MSLKGGRDSNGVLVLAPHAKWRAAIVPAPAENVSRQSADHAHAQPSPARMSWARLLKRVFDIDLEHCPQCGGALKIIVPVKGTMPPSLSRR